MHGIATCSRASVFDADEIKTLGALRYLAQPGSDLRAADSSSRFARLRWRACASAKLAAAITDPRPRRLCALDDEDRRVLLHLRARAGAWLAQAIACRRRI